MCRHPLCTAVSELAREVAKLVAAVAVGSCLRAGQDLVAAEVLEELVPHHLCGGEGEEVKSRLGVGDQNGVLDGGRAHARIAGTWREREGARQRGVWSKRSVCIYK